MTSKIKITLVVLFLCVLSCETYDDDINEINTELNQLKNIQNLLKLKNLLFQSIASENLVTELIDDDLNVKLIFEDDSVYLIKKKLIIGYDIDLDNWNLNFNLSDSSKISVFIVGNELPIKNLKLNPFYNAPLSLTLEIDTPLRGKFFINVLVL